MSKLAVLAVAAGALALTLVSLAPSSAEAGWRRGYWGWGGGRGGPGVGVYVGPRYGWHGPRRYWRPRYPAGYPYAYYPYWRYHYGW